MPQGTGASTEEEAVSKTFPSLSHSVSSLSANGFPFSRSKTLWVRATCPVQARGNRGNKLGHPSNNAPLPGIVPLQKDRVTSIAKPLCGRVYKLYACSLQHFLLQFHGKPLSSPFLLQGAPTRARARCSQRADLTLCSPAVSHTPVIIYWSASLLK